jgi:hypothetical protein
LWGDRLLVSLASAEVCWLWLDAARKPKVLAKRALGADPGHGQEPWQGALAALRSEAEAWRSKRIAVTVVLSNHFVRYVLVPPGPQVSGAAEEAALCRHYVAKVHGEPSRTWDMRLSAAGSEASRIACAIDSGLLTSLRACFPPEGSARLVSVQPLLMSAFNCWRKEFPESGAWLLLVEPERACLALHSGRDWVTLQNARGDYQDPEAWADLLDRERYRANLKDMPDTVLVHAPRSPGVPVSRLSSWKLRGLHLTWPVGLAPHQDAVYASALTAS